MEFLELKVVIAEIKISLFNSMFELSEERISELEDKPQKFSSLKNGEKKRFKKMNKYLAVCETTASIPAYVQFEFQEEKRNIKGQKNI